MRGVRLAALPVRRVRGRLSGRRRRRMGAPGVMTAPALIAALREAGAVVYIASDTGRPAVDAPRGVLTPELREAWAAHRDNLAGALRPRPWSVCPRCQVQLTGLTCWEHFDRLCERCGAWTGRTYRPRCGR